MTRVPRETELYSKIASVFSTAGTVVLCPHVNPDGDALGSVLGLTLALRSLGVSATPVLSDDRPVPRNYTFLPACTEFVRPEEAPVADVFVALDAPSLNRLGSAAGLASNATTVVVIDHHPDNRSFGALNLVEPDAAAVGEMVWRLLPHMGVAPTPDIATALYTALVTDTGRFQYPNTDSETLRDAAAMMEAGADATRVYDSVYENISLGGLRLMGRALARVTEVNGGAVAYSWIDGNDLEETGVAVEETETLIDHVRSLGGAEVVFLVKAVDGECRVSLRSKSGYDVGEAARRFDGGGHQAAAGLTFMGPMNGLLAALLPTLPHRSGDEGESARR